MWEVQQMSFVKPLYFSIPTVHPIKIYFFKRNSIKLVKVSKVKIYNNLRATETFFQIKMVDTCCHYKIYSILWTTTASDIPTITCRGKSN